MHLLPARRELVSEKDITIGNKHYLWLAAQSKFYLPYAVYGHMLSVFTCICEDAFCHFCLLNEYDDDDYGISDTAWLVLNAGVYSLSVG